MKTVFGIIYPRPRSSVLARGATATAGRWVEVVEAPPTLVFEPGHATPRRLVHERRHLAAQQLAAHMWALILLRIRWWWHGVVRAERSEDQTLCVRQHT
jgi:hypothetical protein